MPGPVLDLFQHKNNNSSFEVPIHRSIAFGLGRNFFHYPAVLENAPFS